MGFLQKLLGFLSAYDRPPAPIVKQAPQDNDIDYRFADDEPNVIRIGQARPKGLPKKIANFVKVAGVSYREDDVKAFIRGTNRRLELRREPDNPHSKDGTAVAVFGHFELDGQPQTVQLGYLPHNASQEIAAEYADKPIGATVERMFIAGKGKGPGLRIDVWAPRNKAIK